MKNVIEKAIYEIWLDDPTGKRLTQITTTGGFEYTRKVGDPGWTTITMPGSFTDLIPFPDGIVEYWRGLKNGDLRLEGAYFLRKRKRWSQAGNRFVELAGPGIAEIYERRIIAYKAGTSQAEKTDQYDDMMKALIRENLGSLASDSSRNLTSVGAGLTVEADLADASSASKAFSFKPLKQTLLEISDASRQKGTYLTFDMEPRINDAGQIAMYFRTYTGQRGTDRRAGTRNQVIFGEIQGNLSNPVLEEDYSQEVNYVYVGGQGEGAARKIVEVSDTARINKSIWNRREAWKDGRNSNVDAELQADGNQALNEGRPRIYFSGSIAESEGTRYQRDWDLGDFVTADDSGMQFDCRIEQVSVKVDKDGDDIITASLEYDGTIGGVGSGGAESG